MPELKRNFLKGKMNKDLDERLVPAGEYRDALNVEISSSEDSNEGSAQTLRGNSSVSSLALSSSAVTVGTYVDEEEDKIYNFVHKASDLSGSPLVGIVSDAILQYSKDPIDEAVTTNVVVYDVYETRRVASVMTSNVQITGLPMQLVNINPDVFPIRTQSVRSATGIRPGMRVQAIDSSGVDLWGENDVRVINSTSTTNTGTISITPVVGFAQGYEAQNEYYGSNMISDGVVLKFTSDRVLNFNGGTEELEVNNKKADGTDAYSTAQYTPKNNIITGVNVISDLLYWTDGKDEPKKINIKNSKIGSSWADYGVTTHTRLYIPQTGVSHNYLSKSHATVIKPSPTTAPLIESYSTSREGSTSSVVRRRTGVSGSYNYGGIAFNNNFYDSTNPVVMQPGDSRPNGGSTNIFSPANNNVEWRVGDILDLVGQTSNKTASIRLTAASGTNGFEIELVALDSTYTATTAVESWLASLAVKDSIYNKRFISFAYRYKYTDGETSVISPYSKPVFLPGNYNYDSEEGFNTGMENNLKFLEVKDFIPANIPSDVVSVEVLYRDTNIANQVNSIETFNIGDSSWNIFSSVENRGYLKIETELFGATLPSDQVDRNEDFVPISALAQEITESRLMYGNYSELYDLIDSANKKVELSLDAGFSKRKYEFTTSLEYSENNMSASQDNKLSTTDSGVTATDVYNAVVRCNIENEDPGSNYDPTNYRYTVPITGYYDITSSVDYWAKNRIVANKSGGGTKNFWVIPNAKLRLFKFVDGGTDIEVVLNSNATTSRSVIGESGVQVQQVLINGDKTPFRISSNNAAPDWDDVKLKLTITNAYLSANDVYYIKIEAQTADSDGLPPAFDYNTSLNTPANAELGIGGQTYTPTSWVNATHDAYVENGYFEVSSAPQTTDSVAVTKGAESIKSMRSYNIGVVYRDFANRQSTVLLDKTSLLEVPKSNSNVPSKITARIKSKAPSWAEYYKFFIKENTNNYYNLVLSSSYDNNDALGEPRHAWLAFNSVDVDKIKKEEYIVLKKKHGTQDPVLATSAKWKILDISSGPPILADDTSLIISDSEAVGKFFVKVALDSNFSAYLSSDGNLTPSTNGAVFETEVKRISQSEETSIYWEASDAYPMRLNEENAVSYIGLDTRVELFNSSGLSAAAQSAIASQIENERVSVVGVVGAKTFSKVEMLNSSSSPKCFCSVTVSKTLSNITIPSGGYIQFKFTRKDGSFTTGTLGKSIGSSRILNIMPYTHPTYDWNGTLTIGLPWFNCISFGNGVESDAIRDDFNADTIFEYQASGKTSGFKASAFYEDYKREYKKYDIIFSQIFNEKTSVNRFNEFLIGLPIVKQLNSEYGSIQKLFTRDSDLIAFCEDKVLQIFANKDELFNADGNSQLLGTKDVLGRARPFSGDYGISTNPESFAKDEFRVYFTDKARGSVLRLSKDGLTNISGYGMKDWFFDNLQYAQSLVGSFDGKKDEYNLVIHSVTNPLNKKDVYNISFSETVKGWDSFKSFIFESGVTLNNYYYTFKNAKPWIHHSDNVNRNIFYGIQFDSSIIPMFNDFSGSVKDFRTISYEGTQSRVYQNTNSEDGNYYNLSNVNGWYVNSISTDLQEGQVKEFIDKEGKWFNSISGVATEFTNAALNGGSASGNLDTRELSVQGIGVANATATLISGSIDGFGYNVVGTVLLGNGFTSTNVSLSNAANLSGTSTFTITPSSERAIAASQFATIGSSSYYSSITFADSGTAYDSANMVVGTVNWTTQVVSGNISFNIDLSSVTALILPRTFEKRLLVFHDKTSSSSINFLEAGFDRLQNTTYSGGVLTLTGDSGLTFGGSRNLWAAGSENGEVFTIKYTVDSSTLQAGDLQVAGDSGNTILSSHLTLTGITAGQTYEQDITIQPTGNAYWFYFITQGAAGRNIAMSSISLKRKSARNEVVVISNINSNVSVSADQTPDSLTVSTFDITSTTLEGFVNHEMFTVKLTALLGNVYSEAPTFSLAQSQEFPDRYSLTNEVEATNDVNQIISSQVTVNWLANSSVFYSDNAMLSFGNGVLDTGVALFTLDQGLFTSAAQTISFDYTTTESLPVVSVVSGAWITVEANPSTSWFSGNDFIDGFGTVDITTALNTTGSERTGVVGITTPSNTSGTPDDTIEIVQLASTENYVNIFTFDSAADPFIITNNDTGFEVIEHPTLGNIIELSVFITSNSGTPITLSDIAVTIVDGDAGWLVATAVEAVNEIGDYRVDYYVKAEDSSLYTRNAKIKVTFPGSSEFSEKNIRQLIFNSGTNTISVATASVTGGTTQNGIAYPWFGLDGGSFVVQVTSSTATTPVPIVDLGDTGVIEFNFDSDPQYAAYIDTWVSASDVAVVTGESYTHTFTVTVPPITPTVPGATRSVMIRAYHPYDLGFSQATSNTITIYQGEIYDNLNIS